MNTRSIVRLTVVVQGLAAVLTSWSATVNPGQGLTLSQFDFDFALADQADSSYGLAAVDIGALSAATGISSGYLNIYSSAGWVVQNMPVSSVSGFPGLSVMFNLGNSPGVDVSSLPAFADFSASPSTAFSGTPTTAFPVASLPYGAEGRGALRTAVPSSPINTSVISWQSGGATSAHYQPGHPSVEQDYGQCGPASVANSLQWLEDKKGLKVKLDNVPGIDGNPPNSLPGAIDKKMNRLNDGTVNDGPFITGKLNFISGDPDLRDGLVVKHWGKGFVPGDRKSTDGSVTSKDESVSGISLTDWITQEIAHGEDVELAIGWPGDGGHWVDLTGAGVTLGVPWVSWVHDAYQDQAGGTDWWNGGSGWSPIVDGKLICFIEGGFDVGTVDWAISESVPEPSQSAFAVLVVGGLALVRAFRERKGTSGGQGAPKRVTADHL
jgi:hypothetical protein